MGIFNSNYSKPGPGVSKNEKKKKGLARFYQVFARKFWRLIQLNLLYILTLLPTFAVMFFLSGMISNRVGLTPESFKALSGGAITEELAARLSVMMDLGIRFYVSALFSILWGGGPATAGLVYILRSFLREDPVFLLSDYFKRAKSNFKQAIAVWLIDAAMFCLFCYAYFFYGSAAGIFRVVKYVVLVWVFIYSILHLYIYHLMVSYKMSVPKLYKNAALFAISALPFSVVTLAASVFALLIWPAIGFTSQNATLSSVFVIAACLIMLFIAYSGIGLYIETNAETQIKKYVKEEEDVEKSE